MIRRLLRRVDAWAAAGVEREIAAGLAELVGPESEETIRRDAEVGFLYGLVEHLTEERDALAAQLRGLGVEPVVDTNWTLITGRAEP